VWLVAATLVGWAYPVAGFSDDLLNQLVVARHPPSGVYSGPPASLLTLLHGSLWIHWLRVVEAWGLPLWLLHALLIALCALAAAWMHSLVGRVAPRGRWAASGLYVALTLVLHPFDQTWNASPLPLPIMAAFAGTWSLCLRPTLGALLVAGVGSAVAADLHIAALPLVPLVAGAWTAAARRPLPGLLVLSAIVAPVWALASAPALLHNGRVLAQAPPLVWLALGGALIAGALLSLAWRRLPAGPGKALPLLVAHLGLMGLAAGASVLGKGAVEGRFVLPFLPGVTVGLGVLGARMASRARLVGSSPALPLLMWGVALGIAARTGHPGANAWTVSEALEAARVVAARGWGFQDAWLHVRGPAYHEIVKTFLVRHGHPADGPRDVRDEIQAFKVGPRLWDRRDDLEPRAWTTWPGSPGGGIWMQAFSSWLRLEGARVCALDRGGNELACRDVDPRWTMDPWGPDNPYPYVLESSTTRGDPSFRRGAASFTLHVPVRAAAGEERLLALPLTDCCAWRIRALRGLQTGDALPATAAWILAEGVPGAEVVFEAGDDDRCALGRMPPLVELGRDAPDVLLEAVRRPQQGRVLRAPEAMPTSRSTPSGPGR